MKLHPKRHTARSAAAGVFGAAAACVAVLGAPLALALPLPAAPGCEVFPRDNAWNQRVDRLPVAHGSAGLIRSIGADTGMHADFGSGTWEGAKIGIPITVVDAGQPKVRVRFEYGDESDRGPYPIPADVAIEGGGDRHAIVVDRSTCTLYELYALRRSGAALGHRGHLLRSVSQPARVHRRRLRRQRANLPPDRFWQRRLRA